MNPNGKTLANNMVGNLTWLRVFLLASMQNSVNQLTLLLIDSSSIESNSYFSR